MSNLSAEALAAAEAGLMRKVEGIQHTFGESWEQALRLAGRDTGSRSLAQTADALGKMVEMLGIPARGLWPRIPGVTQQDIEEWQRLDDQGAGPLDRLAATLDRQARPPDVPAPSG